MSEIKPREFWINDRAHSGFRGTNSFRHTAWSKESSVPFADKYTSRIIPVIEKVAFDSVKLELESINKLLEDCKEFIVKCPELMESAMYLRREELMKKLGIIDSDGVIT